MPQADINVVFTDELPEAPKRKSPDAVKTKWFGVAENLRENPGNWAQVVAKPNRINASATAHYIRTGQIKAFEPAGHFEAQVRFALDGEVTEEGEPLFGVFARYIGEVEPEMSDSFMQHSIRDLRELCKKNDLLVSGSKQALADRLTDALGGGEIPDLGE